MQERLPTRHPDLGKLVVSFHHFVDVRRVFLGLIFPWVFERSVVVAEFASLVTMIDRVYCKPPDWYFGEYNFHKDILVLILMKKARFACGETGLNK